MWARGIPGPWFGRETFFEDEMDPQNAAWDRQDQEEAATNERKRHVFTDLVTSCLLLDISVAPIVFYEHDRCESVLKNPINCVAQSFSSCFSCNKSHI